MEEKVELVELLVVEHSFETTNMGLALLPDFPITDNSVARRTMMSPLLHPMVRDSRAMQKSPLPIST
jgi:hypothetical protein